MLNKSSAKVKLKTAFRPLTLALGASHLSPVIGAHVLCDFLRDALLYPVQAAVQLVPPEAPDIEVQRKVTFRMYPNATQTALLNASATAHAKVYNTVLEVSKLRYKAGLPAYTRTTVCEAVKAIRNAHAWIEAATTAQSAQVTGQRLVRAFENFFARLAKGHTPGYPRFKGYKQFKGWGYKTYADGWSLVEQKSKTNSKGRTKHGYSAVKLTAIGSVPVRGASRFLGIPKTAEVIRKNNQWFLSVTMDVAKDAIERTGGNESMAFDWGITTLLTLVVGDPMTGAVEEIENPRWLKAQLKIIAKVQQAIAAHETVAKKASGKDRNFPVNFILKNLYARRRSIHRRLSSQRQDFYHQLTARLIARFGLVVTEELAVANMAKAPKPKEDPQNQGQYLPNGAAAKAGLNRSILDAAPAGLLDKLRYKALEAGSMFQFIPTRTVKPTQRCHICGATTKLTLKERQWTCSCGTHHLRDVNAPRTMLRYAVEGAWWNPDANKSGQELAGNHEVARNSFQA